jgi:hypothetical protein
LKDTHPKEDDKMANTKAKAATATTRTPGDVPDGAKKHVEVYFTKAEVGKLTSTQVFDAMKERVSQERARAAIPGFIADGRIKISRDETGAKTAQIWSYHRISIAGVEYEGLGKKVPEVSYTMDEFQQVSAEDLGAAFVERISPEKAKTILGALLKPNAEGKAVLTLKPEEMVQLSYNRVGVEGIAETWNHGGGSGNQKQEVTIDGVSG